MKRSNYPFNARIACMLTALLAPVIAFAQGGDGTQILSQVHSGLTGMGGTLIQVAQALLAVGGVVIFVVVVYDLLKGEREGATKVGKFLIGIALGYVILEALKALIK